ncbi:lantibiotic dehydratase family protein [Flavobacterium urocaniciphilum]|uniref:lantibiotic dehydratase family protein n=1 Tax=Flavobacterium urocaniciphilum TaxID=1299341 RepID=UPI0015A50149|nr:lantibiotic dehydratase family protein [Flavobacterium urocaniciphilum]
MRTPLFPINFYTQLLTTYSSDRLFKILEEDVIKNAIGIASPELIAEFEKLKSYSEEINSNKKINLELALLKYIARLSSRATPFGTFAGCSAGVLANETSIEMDAMDKHEVFMQFDMHYWINLLKDIAQNPNVQKELIYYPNSSLYKITDFYRYVEYQYVNKKREHVLSSFRLNQVIDILIENAKSGIKFKVLVNLITEDESEMEAASEFVLELINCQILISELEATITGVFDIKRIIKILKSIPSFKTECNLLEEMAFHLNSKTHLQNLENRSNTLNSLVSLFVTDFEEKYLLQYDLFTKTKNSLLNKKVSLKVEKALRFLSRIKRNNENVNLSNFKKAYLKRYETREMPLSVVLDSELGIGYLQHTTMNDTHTILDRFAFDKSKKGTTITENWTKLDYILEKKLKESILNSQSIIVLEDKDFEFLNVENKKYPNTFSVMVEIFNEEDKDVISIESSGTISAAKLIGRFCNGNEAIHDLANEIIQKEAALNSDKILAEIVHIPQSRTGNVLKRPALREYEIPYLSNSILPKDNQIDIEDLSVSIKDNTVVLKSKKLNKEIIPCLSNAHNYSYNSLPIYHFLCDLQGQSVQSIPNFSWGFLENHYDYFPRVVYAEVILSKAKWIIDFDELNLFLKLDFEKFTVWKNQKRIPQFVNLVNGDNTLLLDLNVEIGLKLLLNSIKPHSKIILEEFLFKDNSVVKDAHSNSFANQFILSYYNSN